MRGGGAGSNRRGAVLGAKSSSQRAVRESGRAGYARNQMRRTLAADDGLKGGPHSLALVSERRCERLEIGKVDGGGDAALDAGCGLGGIERAGDRQTHELRRVRIEPVRVD